jgi:hypothetical protein
MACRATSERSSRPLPERLIGFATVSRDSNPELTGFVPQYLADHGVDSGPVHHAGRTMR